MRTIAPSSSNDPATGDVGIHLRAGELRNVITLTTNTCFSSSNSSSRCSLQSIDSTFSIPDDADQHQRMTSFMSSMYLSTFHHHQVEESDSCNNKSKLHLPNALGTTTTTTRSLTRDIRDPESDSIDRTSEMSLVFLEFSISSSQSLLCQTNPPAEESSGMFHDSSKSSSMHLSSSCCSRTMDDDDNDDHDSIDSLDIARTRFAKVQRTRTNTGR